MNGPNRKGVFGCNAGLLLVLVGTFLTAPASAHLMPSWSYQQMFDKADVVVIARDAETRDTAERVNLPGVSPPLVMIGASAEFKSLLVLKGDQTHLTTFTVHYYRLPDPPPAIVNGPLLPDFHSAKGSAYLLFLKKEADGRYAPVTDSMDSAIFCALKLNGLAD